MTDKSKANNLKPIPLGSIAAALISAAMGCLAISIAHQAATQSKALEAIISNLAFWIPDSLQVSSYPGKETIGLNGTYLSVRSRGERIGMIGLYALVW